MTGDEICSRIHVWICVAAMLMTSAMTFQTSGMTEVTSPVDEDGRYNFTVKMDRHFTEKEEYVCVGHKLDPQETYILQFTPHANMSTAHHLIVYGCHLPSHDNYTEAWECPDFEDNGISTTVCKDGPRNIMWVWANDAPAFTFPKDVGYRISGSTGLNYLILQMHYSHGFEPGQTDSSGLTLLMTARKQPRQANYYIGGSQGTSIPPLTPYFPVEVSSHFDLNYTIYPIGFRVHSHDLGVVTSGYRIRDGEWTEIGRMSPQLPQQFYPVSNPGMDIKFGDGLAIRCSFNSMARDYVTPMGAHGFWKEMCNFYIMYATDFDGDTTNEGFWNFTPIPWTVAFPNTTLPADASALPAYRAAWVRAKFNDTSDY